MRPPKYFMQSPNLHRASARADNGRIDGREVAIPRPLPRASRAASDSAARQQHWIGTKTVPQPFVRLAPDGGEWIDAEMNPLSPLVSDEPQPWSGGGMTAMRHTFAYVLLLTLTIALFSLVFVAELSSRSPNPLAAGYWVFLLSISTITLLAFKVLLWLRYRPRPPLNPAEAPPLTVVIPAYNEGAMVEATVHSVAAARYPSERLQIIVVDDGSRDDTWTYISRAAAHCARRVAAVRFERNQGKRAALMEGFRRATGEVVVTIDSDSVIDTDTLLAIVAPFRDSKVGVVAGKVAVHNLHEGFIPRMLKFVYALSFDFQRAAESRFRTVYCVPGALAAYRTIALRRVQERWFAQTFLGAACTYGEDRALTNYLLAQGYDAVYQSNAEVRTMVPITYRKLCKMLLRWDRSFIREELRLAAILWHRPLRYRCIVLWDKVTTDLVYVVQYATLGALPFLLTYHPVLLLQVAVGIALSSVLFMLIYFRHERSWLVLDGLIYAFFSMATLFWILPYALFSPRKQAWLTR